MKSATETRRARLAALAFGAVDLVSALLVFLGVFRGLPFRYGPVDAVAGALLLLFLAAGIGLVSGAPWGPAIARITSVASLGTGLALVTTLAFTASYLSGVYGPVGQGGALILALVAALALPYLVALPAAQLVWLGPFQRADGEPSAAREDAKENEAKPPRRRAASS